MDGWESSRVGEGLRPEEEGDTDMRARDVSGRKEGQWYHFRI
jgi:hypothetical protein